MAWARDKSGSNIPAWIKRQVRARQDNKCNTLVPSLCTGGVQEYDHIVNIKALRTDRAKANDPSNIQGLCIPCHRAKTQAEAKAGMNRHKRRPQQHPGLVR